MESFVLSPLDVPAYFFDTTNVTNYVEVMESESERAFGKNVIFGLRIVLWLFGLSVGIFYVLTHWTRAARYANKFPGPKIIPFVGNYNHLMRNAAEWQETFSGLVGEYGTCFRLWFSYKPYICVADGKIAEKILLGYDNIEKADNYEAFHRSLGQGLATAEGNKWRRDRKILNPAFGYQYFEGFLKIFNEQSETMIELLKTEFPATKSTNQPPPKNLLIFLARCTIDSVYQTALGAHKNVQRDPKTPFAEMIYGLVHCTREKIMKPWLNFPVIWTLFGMGKQEENYIGSILKELGQTIDEKKEEKEQCNSISGTHTKPFLAFLMDFIEDKTDLAYHMTTLGATGSETTSSALNYLLFLLALNPECQKKLLEELDSVFEGDKERDVTLADLPQLKYMEMCIKESLRLYPPVSAWFRRITTDVPLEDGKLIPKGSQVLILPWDIHRNPKVFSNPERFQPDRFSPENRDKIGSNWLAFSLGPRNCIGQRYGMMQMKAILSHLLRNFEVTTDQKREDLKVIYGVVLEPLPEIKLSLRLREH